MAIAMETEGSPNNRIITYPVGGGFKQREPRAQEMKDVWTFLAEKLWGGD